MQSSAFKTTQFLAYAILPVMSSILLGLLLCGTAIFNPYNMVAQFVTTSIIASLFYSLLVNRNVRDAYAGLFVLLVLTIVYTHSHTGIYILRTILYAAGIGAAVHLYFTYFKAGANTNYMFSAVTLAGLYAASCVISSEMYLAILRFADQYSTSQTVEGIAIINAFFGSAIGFAIGAGITVANKVVGQIKGAQIAET